MITQRKLEDFEDLATQEDSEDFMDGPDKQRTCDERMKKEKTMLSTVKGGKLAYLGHMTRNKVK